jgi:hypothetical protein
MSLLTELEFLWVCFYKYAAPTALKFAFSENALQTWNLKPAT